LRRLAWCAAALAAACGGEVTPLPGPLDHIVLPTGIAFQGGQLLVASSNADLLFDVGTGGAVIAIDPASGLAQPGGANITSFAGELAVADPAICTSIGPLPLAITPTRGANTLNVLTVDGAKLTCDGRCGLPLSGGGIDPLAVTVGCSARGSRAYVGYLQAQGALAWVSQFDLNPDDPSLRHMSLGTGPVRGFAYDPARERLYALGVATATPTPLRWLDLAGCDFGAPGAAGCTVHEATFPEQSTGIELRAMALASTSAPGAPQRAYLVGRRYNVITAATVGGRADDLGGVLLSVDLVDDPFGGLEIQVVNEVEFGRGAEGVRLLPHRPGLRDVVVALAQDAGELLVYDDETGAYHVIGRDEATGVPFLGHQPFGLAVDPVPVGSVAKVYVGGFRESWVTPVNVSLDAVDLTSIVQVGGAPRRITGAAQ
jgi:hypothetical protein